MPQWKTELHPEHHSVALKSHRLTGRAAAAVTPLTPLPFSTWGDCPSPGRPPTLLSQLQKRTTQKLHFLHEAKSSEHSPGAPGFGNLKGARKAQASETEQLCVVRPHGLLALPRTIIPL